MDRQRLIVTADDFGLSSRANRNILHLISLGKIDRVGVMVHGNITPNELDQLLKSGVKLDIHLDIKHEFPAQTTLPKNVFVRGLTFLWSYVSRKFSTSKVQSDWCEQIEMFNKLVGRNPDGINSHEHVHFFPPFFKLALKIAEQYSIPYIRIGESGISIGTSLISKILHLLRILNKKKFSSSSNVSSKSLVSIDWISDMDNFLDNLPAGTIEFVCHPAIAEDFVSVKKYF